MPLSRTKFLKLLRSAISLFILALIIGYAVWRSFAYAQGPKIEVFTPQDGSTVASSSVEIVGRALRINSIQINGNPLTLDEQGNFKDIRAVFAGMNVITVSATDQFGRSTQKELRVIGAPAAGF